MPILTLRLSNAELAAIDLAAATKGLRRSAYARKRLLPSKAVPPDRVDWDAFFARPRRRMDATVADEVRRRDR